MSSVGSTTTRFVGMASGLDVDTIVTNLMKAEQLKVDKITQKKTYAEWQKDAYKEVNTLVSNFMNKYLSSSSPTTNINLKSSYNIKKIVTSTSQYATITAGSTAVDGAYTINSITSLATGSNKTSATKVSTNQMDKISTTSTLADLSSKLGTALVFETNLDVDNNEVKTLSFSINGKDFTFNDTDSLSTVISTVNKSDAGVTMVYSSLSDKLTITSKTLGTSTGLDVQNTTGNFCQAFGIATGTISNGTNAVLEVNGNEVVQTSNTFTIDGVSYSLIKPTDQQTDFSVSQDIDASYNKIKGFIDGYNELISTLNSKISEERYRTYTPLTDAQKAEMKEADITAWEKKAKSGLVKSDANIRKLLTEIRNSFSQTVESAGITFADIGITTGELNAGAWANKGKLVIDETKLRNALSNNTEAVTNLFMKTSTATDAATNYNESGLVQRINNSMKSYTKFSTANTITYTNEKISSFSTKYTEAIEKMKKKEDYYYKVYASLETAMSKMNSQSSYFSSLSGTSS